MPFFALCLVGGRKAFKGSFRHRFGGYFKGMERCPVHFLRYGMGSADVRHCQITPDRYSMPLQCIHVAAVGTQQVFLSLPGKPLKVFFLALTETGQDGKVADRKRLDNLRSLLLRAGCAHVLQE